MTGKRACIPSAESDSCCVCSDGACMVFCRGSSPSTPSLRTRVVVRRSAPRSVLIVGTVVWVRISNDRKKAALGRRLDEGRGFLIRSCSTRSRAFSRPGRPHHTVRRGNDQVNSDITLPKLQDDYADTYVRGVRYRVRGVAEIRARSRRRWRWRDV